MLAMGYNLSGFGCSITSPWASLEKATYRVRILVEFRAKDELGKTLVSLNNATTTCLFCEFNQEQVA